MRRDRGVGRGKIRLQRERAPEQLVVETAERFDFDLVGERVNGDEAIALIAALAINAVFDAAGLIPTSRPTESDVFGTFALDYKFVLNAIATIVFVTHSVFKSVYLSSRITVMAARPGRVVAEIPVDASVAARASRVVGAPDDLEGDDLFTFVSTTYEDVIATLSGCRARFPYALRKTTWSP